MVGFQAERIASIRGFLAAVPPLIRGAQKADAELCLRLGYRFRYSDYIRLDEPSITSLLRDLLDPDGPHGQGDLFLRLFLQPLNVEIGQSSHWRVYKEYPTRYGRRIDLMAKCDREVAIGIENKPWGEEGEEQLEDYALELLSMADVRQKYLLFMPGTHVEPKSITASTRARLGGNFQIYPYVGDGRSTVRWLEHCAEQSQSEKVRIFLRDLSSYFDAQFDPSKGGRSMPADPAVEMIMDAALSDQSVLRGVFGKHAA